MCMVPDSGKLVNENKKVAMQFFDYAFILFGIFYAVKESQLNYLELRFITYPTLILSVAFSMLSVFHNYRWNLLHVLVFLLVVFYSFVFEDCV